MLVRAMHIFAFCVQSAIDRLLLLEIAGYANELGLGFTSHL